MAENTWDRLDHFKFARFKFNLRAVDFLPLPDYWGQVFDTAFRHSFRKAVCSCEGGICKDCERLEKCAYLYVFETPLPRGPLKNICFLPIHSSWIRPWTEGGAMIPEKS